MIRQISSEIIQRIDNIQWFAHCDEPFDLKMAYPTRQVQNWRRAEVHWKKQSWQDAQEDARNVISSYLGKHYPQDFDCWNDLVDIADKDLQDAFCPFIEAFAHKNALAQSFLSNVQWDITHAIMEETYSDCHLPVTFYSELLRVYEAGHMPCGWAHGDWPNGTLIVY